jgi:NitT/TauT family transport system substrate-binding protein
MPVLSQVTAALPESQSAIMLYGKSLLDDNVDAGNRFMMAYLKAVRQYNAGKTGRNQEILAKYMQLDPATMQEMCWPSLRADGSLNHESIVDFQDWAVDRGFSEQTLPIEEIVDERFLNAANQVLGVSP